MTRCTARVIALLNVSCNLFVMGLSDTVCVCRNNRGISSQKVLGHNCKFSHITLCNWVDLFRSVQFS